MGFCEDLIGFHLIWWSGFNGIQWCSKVKPHILIHRNGKIMGYRDNHLDMIGIYTKMVILIGKVVMNISSWHVRIGVFMYTRGSGKTWFMYGAHLSSYQQKPKKHPCFTSRYFQVGAACTKNYPWWSENSHLSVATHIKIYQNASTTCPAVGLIPSHEADIDKLPTHIETVWPWELPEESHLPTVRWAIGGVAILPILIPSSDSHPIFSSCLSFGKQTRCKVSMAETCSAF